MAIEPIKPVAFTVPDAVSYSGLSRSRLYKLMQEKELPALRVGGRRMILRQELDSFIARCAEA